VQENLLWSPENGDDPQSDFLLEGQYKRLAMNCDRNKAVTGTSTINI